MLTFWAVLFNVRISYNQFWWKTDTLALDGASPFEETVVNWNFLIFIKFPRALNGIK